MFRINFLLNILILLGIFIVDAFTQNILMLFSIFLFLLFPKIRGIVLNKKVKTNLIYELIEFILNLFLIIILLRSLFDPTINIDNLSAFSYSYVVIRVLICIVILFIMNLLLHFGQNKEKKLIENKMFIVYLMLYISIFSIYFHFSSIISFLLICVNIGCCFYIINKIRREESIALFVIIVCLIGVFLSNEILILFAINLVGTKYFEGKKIFY